MRTMRRSIPLVAAMVAVPLALGSCSSSDGGEDGTVQLTYWLWDSLQKPAYEDCAAAFETENPGVSVTIEQYGWDDYWTNLQTNLVADSAPDVFVNHIERFPELAAKGQIQDLRSRVDADGLDLGVYQEGLAELWVGQEGERYGLPKDWDTVALFYNADMIAEAGYTPEQLAELEWNPTDGGTYEAFLAHLTVDANGVRGDEEGFDKDDVEVYGIGLGAAVGAGSGQVENAMYTLSTGWDYLDENPWGTRFQFDDERYVDTVTWWRSLIEKGYMPTVQMAKSSGNVKDPFGAGRYATVTEGDWNANSYAQLPDVDVAFAPTPIGPGGERASVFNGVADSIWSGTDHPDEAWAWVSYLASPSCQERVAEHAVVFPAVKSASEIAATRFEEKGMDMSAFTIQVEEGTTHLPPVTDHWSEVQSVMQPAMDDFMAFKEGPDSLVSMNDEINALFE